MDNAQDLDQVKNICLGVVGGAALTYICGKSDTTPISIFPCWQCNGLGEVYSQDFCFCNTDDVCTKCWGSHHILSSHVCPQCKGAKMMGAKDIVCPVKIPDGVKFTLSGKQ